MIPFLIDDNEIEQEELSVEKESSKTYKIDFNTGEVYAEFIDFEEAIKQAVIKALKTQRNKYFIYSESYGSELIELIGESHSLEYLKIEVPRLISETFLDDDRIIECKDFEVNAIGDSLYCSFLVVTDIQSDILVEVEI